MIEMPDVNVLVAMFDTLHPHNDIALDWFNIASSTGWALCPLNISGFLRVVSRPGYSSTPGMKAATDYLNALILAYSNAYSFWPDTISLLDKSLFDLTKLQGYRQLTDLHLLGIAHRNSGTLVTLDTGFTTTQAALIAPASSLVRLLTP